MSQSLITSFFTPTTPVRKEQLPGLPQPVPAKANDAAAAETSGESSAISRARKRGTYEHFGNATKFSIAKFAAENGIASAMNEFGTEGNSELLRQVELPDEKTTNISINTRL